MERPTWKNTLHGDDAGIRITARQIGYPYFCLERLVYPVQPNGAYGSWPDYPVCTEDELDNPGGVNWWDGARPALTAARHLLEELSETPTLQRLVMIRLGYTTAAVLENRQSDAAHYLGETLKVLDDTSIRNAYILGDPDGLIAAVGAAVVKAKAVFD